MTGRKIGMVVTTWRTIPWNRNCDACIHFCAAPPAQQENMDLMLAVWNHFYLDHHIEMIGDASLAKRLGKEAPRDGLGYGHPKG